MQKIISKFFILLFVLYSSCENKTSRDKEGLIVYLENQISWVRNFEPLNPVSIPRWPTRGGIYESLYLNNPITTDWIPWLATNYKWENNNKKLLFTTRSNVQWSDGKPFSAHDVAYTLNLWNQYPALDTRNAWEYLKSVVAVSDTLVQIDFKRIYVPGFAAIAGAPIIPKHIWKELEDPLDFSTPAPVGTGPFTEILRFNTQVWELGKYLGDSEEIVNSQPTDGLWDDGRNDVQQLGMSYEDLEKAMENKDAPNYQKYLKIREKNLHKMNPIPVCKFNE